ncbi:hypothetical protein [Leptolyngbya ohadii]
MHPHSWTDFEMDLIRETAERIWTSLERARVEAISTCLRSQISIALHIN